MTFPGAATESDFYESSIKRIGTLERLSGGRGALRKILLAYGAVAPWSSRDAFAKLVDRYGADRF